MKRILLACCIIFVTIACSSNSSDRDGNINKEKMEGSSENYGRAEFLEMVQDSLNLDENQKVELEKVLTKYGRIIEQLKNNGDWHGKENLENRKQVTLPKNREIRNIIGDDGMNEWNRLQRLWKEMTDSNQN